MLTRWVLPVPVSEVLSFLGTKWGNSPPHSTRTLFLSAAVCRLVFYRVPHSWGCLAYKWTHSFSSPLWVKRDNCFDEELMGWLISRPRSWEFFSLVKLWDQIQVTHSKAGLELMWVAKDRMSHQAKADAGQLQDRLALFLVGFTSHSQMQIKDVQVSSMGATPGLL